MKVEDLHRIAKSYLKRFIGGAQTSLDELLRGKAPRTVLSRLNSDVLSFFSRRRPVGDKYAYEVHYAPALANVPTHLDRFYLVGRNWRFDNQKPVAVAFGFNDWKYGFFADYCPEMRIAYAPRKYVGLRARLDLRRMRPRPSCIYVWGYTDRPWMQRFAQRRGIPLVRVEDAFLRSADLGASHATPYSLVFDRKGLYYNTEEPNDLADILKNYDFAGDPRLMQEARKALDLLIEKRLSKYNPPDLDDPARHFAVKTRKRVLVIGQVDNDAAVRLGNPEEWRMTDIVRLAKLENPDAEILYRPHPETYQGYQRTKFKALVVTNFATIVPPEGPLLDLLETVDHVYTISSLTGLEALVRGIKVTTLGTPFYAGWGLTDDRVKQPNGRNLSALELFAGTYLKYPRYLANLEDSWFGLRVSVLRILADREVQQSARTPKSDRPDDVARLASGLAWPRLLLPTRNGEERAEPALPVDRIVQWLRDNPSDRAHSAVAHAVLGGLRSPEQRDRMLAAISDVLSPAVANELLLHLIDAEGPRSYHAKHLAELVHRADPGEASARVVTAPYQKRVEREEGLEADAVNEAANAAGELAYLESRLAAEMNDARYEQASVIAKRLLIRAGLHVEAFLALAEIALVRFDFTAVRMLAGLLFLTGEPKAVNKAPSLELEAMEDASSSYIAEIVSRYLAFKPDKIVNAVQALERYSDPIELEQTKADVLATVNLGNSLNVAKVQSLLALESRRQALETAEQLARERPHLPQVAVVFAQALAANDQIKPARKVIEQALKVHPTSLVYREALRLCVLDNDYESGMRLLSQAMSRRIDLGDMLPRKIYFGVQRIQDAFAMFKDFHLRREMIRHFPEKYCREPLASEPGRSIFIAAIFGPGDEVRWSYIYNLLPSVLPHDSIRLSCDPRLHSMMQRSFPHIRFVPVRRIRNADRYAVSDFNRVPSSRLVGVLDNNAVDEIEAADDFVLMTDLPSDVLLGYESFSGKSYLRADAKRAASFRERLPQHLPLVGLSWRSSVLSFSRNEHYLTIEELAPLFEIPGVQFVNLQYDDCEEELAWVEKNFPGKLINFADLDQFNDLDGAAALMTNMDLVIAPATTVVELAGALGCPTWLLSNSSELHWRRREDFSDVWHASVRHVESRELGSKQSLLNELVAEMKEWLKDEVASSAPAESQVRAVSP